MLIPNKDWKPAMEQGSVLGNTCFHQGWGPCMGHHIHKWPWEGQESPRYVGPGPGLTSWRAQALGRYLQNGTYDWYDRYCAWAQDLLYGSRAQVTRDDVIVGRLEDQATNENREGSGVVTVTAATARAVVAEDSSEKPSGHGCGPRQVRLFCEGPLCSRSREVPCWEHGTRNNTKGNQYWGVLAAMS